MVTQPTGDMSYQVVPEWERRPPDLSYKDAAGVATDSENRVYVLTRGPAAVLVYASDGTFLGSWGEGLFTERTHGITIESDHVWVADDGDHTVHKFDLEGNHILTLGVSGQPSDTGYDGKDHGSVQRPGEPFNRPTNVAVASDGTVFVADGYGNCRVHAFSREGDLLRAWGGPGSGPGEFRLPHGIAILANDSVAVADRENDRIQVFTPDGDYVTAWTDVQRPTHLAIEPRTGAVYVSELEWRQGQQSFVHGDRGDLPSRVSVLDNTGEVLERWRGPEPCTPGGLVAPHGIAVDTIGNVYVAEVTWTIGVSRGRVPASCPTLQKFRPSS